MISDLYPVDTWVTIDGVEAPASAEELGDGTPTILDGLSFTWGRGTTVDQPDVSTCALTIRQQLRTSKGAPVPSAILEACHQGSQVEVWAGGTVPPGPTSQQIADWSTGALGRPDPARWDLVSGTVSAAVAVAEGRTALWLDRADVAPAGSSVTALFPTQRFADSTDPTAWDDVPRLLPGQSWPITAVLWAPRGNGRLEVVAYAYDSPTTSGRGAAAVVTGADGQPLTVPQDGAWHTVTGTVTLARSTGSRAGAWIVPGVAVRFDSTTWAAATGTWAQRAGTWQENRQAGVQSITLTQNTQTRREVLVWAGRVQNVALTPAGYDALQMAVTAVDPAAPLNRDNVGDEPWSAEPLGARAARITDLTRDSDRLSLLVDPGLESTQISYQDVDSQPALALLQDLATSAGAVLWVAGHATLGTYLWVEDIDQRGPIRQWVVTSGGILALTADQGATKLSASDLLLEPVQVTQDATTVVTGVAVTWLLQGTAVDSDTGLTTPTTTEQTVQVIDEAAAAIYDVQLLEISTQLTSAADAQALANRLLTQARAADWRLDGLAIDTTALVRPIPELDDFDRITAVLDLLDGTTRLGRPIELLDLPDWIPADKVSARVYLEGGTYSLTSSRWGLELTVSPAGGQGEGHTASWAEMPGEVSWSDVPRSFSWSDAVGVAAPAQ